MNKKTPEVGDLISVEIHKSKKGNFPIGKHGRIFCKLFIPKSVGRIYPGDTCLVEVTAKKENFLLCTVKEVIKTAAANNFEVLMKLREAKAEDQSGNKRKKNLPIAEALERAAAKIKQK